MFVFRRNRYMDFVICSLFCLLVIYAYYSRQGLLNRLQKKELVRQGLEENAMALKEELKIVYYHVTKLEEALKGEKERRKITDEKLETQVRDYISNITDLQKRYKDDIDGKDSEIKAILEERDQVKKELESLQRQYTELSLEHKRVGIELRTEYDTLKKAKETESIGLQDRIQEVYNQKVHFQKKALEMEAEYKKAMKNFEKCKTVLSRKKTVRKAPKKRKVVRKKASKPASSRHVNVRKTAPVVKKVTKPVIATVSEEDQNLVTEGETIAGGNGAAEDAGVTNEVVDIHRDNVITDNTSRDSVIADNNDISKVDNTVVEVDNDIAKEPSIDNTEDDQKVYPQETAEGV